MKLFKCKGQYCGLKIEVISCVDLSKFWDDIFGFTAAQVIRKT